MQYFERRGLFTKPGDSPDELSAAKEERRRKIIRGVQAQIDDVYDAVAQSCLARADGNQQQADYLQDCSYWEYYYRIMTYNEFVRRKNEATKKSIEDAKSK